MEYSARCGFDWDATQAFCDAMRGLDREYLKYMGKRRKDG